MVRLGLLLLSVALLTFSFAPYKQFYLAWVGLVPWLAVVASTRTSMRAFGWGWLGGLIFFAVNLAWLWRATIPGAIALAIYLALFWGLAGVLIRGYGLLEAKSTGWRAAGAVFGVAAVWVASEWLRATLLTGLPWILLGQTQSPLTVMCQVADFAGVYGVAFWLAAVNALLALAVIHRSVRQLVIPVAATAGMLLTCLGYGLFRLAQDTTYPGPRVMVVQPNHQHQRGGAKTVTQQQQVDFHLSTTERELTNNDVDLVVWSETVMPPLNPEARAELRAESSGPFLVQVDGLLSDLARRCNTALVTGGYYVGGWESTNGKRVATDIRNAAFVYHRDGSADTLRYDKIHLVPFGESLPFRESAPRLHRLLKYLAAYSVDYGLVAAPPDALTVFEIKPDYHNSVWTKPARFVTPICFEDMDGPLVARMFRPGPDGRKRADIIVNLTNDGWFLRNQQAQHLQAAIFRSIENRAPTARADNTGISGFIDSSGRALDEWLIPVRTEGTLTHRLALDRRIAPYSRVGDLFSYICLAGTAGMAGWNVTRNLTRPGRTQMEAARA